MTQQKQQGFTLIEVMISILLAALLVIGAVALFRIETRASSFSRRETEAVVLAQDKLEELRTIAQPTGAGTGADPGSINEQGVVVTGGMYTRTWIIANSNDVFDIEVHVAWDDSGDPREVIVRGRR
jgi:prepilin-type N-terminal cleavage/methylation domain-containing protein